MARYPEHLIQQAAQATDIVELISQYVALKKRGKEFVGLCPFHDDHKPSLNVSPVKQIYKCFSCGAGGGVYQFLMQYEKLSFPEAVRMLAERAGITLPRADEGRQGQGGFSKNDLIEVVAFAVRYFQGQLRSDSGAEALKYALDRGLKAESIERFALGYALDSWDALVKAGSAKGIAEARLLAAGLAAKRDGGSGCYDRFRNRLMFPIFDPQNRPIGFGGRALAGDERAKYINSPESVVYDKSAQLYALNWSREAIVASGQAVVVEGYLDALVPLQQGLGNVVATLGTALTERHVRLLSRHAGQAVLVFDPDTAGQAAAERALEIFLAQRLHVRVATVPSGKDPCDFCLSEGIEALQSLIAQAPDALQYVWLRRQSAWREAGGNLADRSRLIEEFLTLVVSCSAYGAIDEVRRGQLAQHIAHLLNVPAVDLQQQMRRLARRIPRGSRPAGRDDQPDHRPRDSNLAERQVLEVLLNCPELFDQVAERLDPADFAREQYRHIAEAIWPAGAASHLNLEELLASPDLAEFGNLLTDLAGEGRRRGNYQPTLAGAMDHMLYRRGKEDMQGLKKAKDSDEALKELSKRLKTPDLRRRPSIS